MSRLEITVNRRLFLGRQVHVVHPALNCGQVFVVIRRRQLPLLKVAHECQSLLEWMQEAVQAAAACHWEADTVLAAASATAMTNCPVIPEEPRLRCSDYMAVHTHMLLSKLALTGRRWQYTEVRLRRVRLVQVGTRARGKGGDISR